MKEEQQQPDTKRSHTKTFDIQPAKEQPLQCIEESPASHGHRKHESGGFEGTPKMQRSYLSSNSGSMGKSQTRAQQSKKQQYLEFIKETLEQTRVTMPKTCLLADGRVLAAPLSEQKPSGEAQQKSHRIKSSLSQLEEPSADRSLPKKQLPSENDYSQIESKVKQELLSQS